jgi:cystathionine gamma-synthase
MSKAKEMNLKTRTVRAALETDTQYGAVVPPIHLTSTFAFAGYGDKRAYDYSRSGNPTRDALAGALADLEGGAGAVVTSSGMAAVALVTQLFRPGQVAVVPHDCYGGTYRLFNALRERGSLDVRFVDFQDAAALRAALDSKPALVWIETPSNPLLRIVDLAAVAAAAHGVGALVAADNTFLSPVWQRPIALGADVVVHSTTKYLNGHSDVVGGAVVAAPGRTALVQRVQSMNNLLGTSQSPHDAFLVLRGLKTLLLRMKAHEAGAAEVAAWLERHPAVARVHYPGLASHPQHALACRQQHGFGAMLSFELEDGRPDRVNHVLRSLRWFTLAESLGGVESLVAHPASMTHASMTPEARKRAGITDSVIRLSIGIEDPADLIADLAETLAAIPG